MFIPKQFVRIILFSLAGFLILPSALEAYPYAFRRLVLKSNFRIVKAIDLISDVHVPEVMNCTSLDQGPTEKALFASIKKIVQKHPSQGIEIFGESSPEDIDCCGRKSLLFMGGMWLTLHKLHKEIHELNAIPYKNKKPIYTHANCYRGRIAIPQDFLDPQNPIDRDLANIKNNLDAQAYSTLEKLWLDYKKRIQWYCFPKSSNNVRDYFADDQVIKDQSFQKVAIIAKAMDFEVLIKVLKSLSQHNIVLAGGAHCAQLNIWLTRNYGFTSINHVGPNEMIKLSDKIEPLSLATWQYLESDPFTPYLQKNVASLKS